MHILNRLFKKIYVITVSPPNDRIIHFTNYFKNIDLTFDLRISSHKKFFNEFIHGETHINESEQSLTANYASIIYESYYNDIENFVILEDDNIFNDNFNEEFELFYKNLPDDWDVLHLSDYDIEQHILKKSINDYCDRIFIKYTTNCMIFRNPTRYKSIADVCINSKYPIDYVLNSLYQENKLISYAPTKKLTYQSSYRVESENILPNKKFSSLIRFTK